MDREAQHTRVLADQLMMDPVELVIKARVALGMTALVGVNILVPEEQNMTDQAVRLMMARVALLFLAPEAHVSLDLAVHAILALVGPEPAVLVFVNNRTVRTQIQIE
jgi:hypothetical protein